MVIRPTTAPILLIAIIALWWQATPTGAQSSCHFTEGFAAFRALVGPDNVGDCVEDEHINADNRNVEQQTTGGLLFWRAVDSVFVFTDGATSWVNGPEGLQSRPNGERFAWESAPEPPSQAATSSSEAGADASPLSNIPSLFGLAPPPATATATSPAAAPAVPATPTTIPTPTAPTSSRSAATPTRVATPGSTSTPTISSAAGRTDPIDGQCPATHRIKGVTSRGQKVFYEPDRPEYAKATPEVCFTAGGDARDAGYISGKR